MAVKSADFDYVIVGGGTAGCVIASRLSQDPDVTVLVLEAGAKARGLDIEVPGAIGSLYNRGKHHWPFKSEPETYASDQRLPYKLGRVLGGSSAINGMIWVRGNPSDFDNWEAEGCKGWSYKDVEPVYRRIEAFEDKSDLHMGLDGPISLQRGNAASPLNKAFLDSAEQAGYDRNDNYNGPNQLGFGAYHHNIRDGRRADVYRGYLQPALTRKNLTVYTHAKVSRVIVENGHAGAIEFQRYGKITTVSVGREIILSAGALATPQILQLSGIGDPKLLASLNIPLVADLPAVDCKLPVSLYPATKFPGIAIAGLEWLWKKTGPAASCNFDVGGFVKTRKGLAAPNLQITFVAVAPKYQRAGIDGHGFEIHMENIGCKSRGSMQCISNRPDDLPRFSFNFLKDERDMDTFLAGTDIAREISSQPAFAPYLGDQVWPPADTRPNADWVRDNVSISHHLAGSCRMGPQENRHTVVGPDLRVHTISGLRVADASIMPNVTSGNTHAPCVMIGEMAADLILAERGSDKAERSSALARELA